MHSNAPIHHQIETRYATGEVKGKYGYIDPTGALREVEYGATPGRGFEPRAEGLVVAPPTLADEGRTKFNSLSHVSMEKRLGRLGQDSGPIQVNS